MAKIERFEELQSWQKARQLTNMIYKQDELTAAYNLATETKRLINERHDWIPAKILTTQLINYRTTKLGD